MAMEKYRPLFIGGEWVEATGGKTAETSDPSTGEVIGKYAVGTKEDVHKAVAAAKRAFENGWCDTTPSERSEILIKIANIVDENVDELGRLDSIDMGMPIAIAQSFVPYVADIFRFFAGVARCPEGKASQEYDSGVTSMIRREPLGVTAGICPWNYPLMMLAWKLAPALAAGNTSVIKPASLTTLSALYFAELVKDEIPAGLLNVITGPGREIGDAICSNPDVKLVSMTGSTATGKHIAEICAGTLKRVHLELGGKAPVVVFDDADIDAVVSMIKERSYINSGQDCGQPCRIIASEVIYDELVERLVAAVKEIKVGASSDTDVEVGPVVGKAHLEDIKDKVEGAIALGAKVEVGGKVMKGNGYYFEPTVITGADQKSEIIQKEVFGPVVTVQRFNSEDQALEMANDVVYGLAGSVWTKDISRAMKFSKKIQAGTVWVNTHLSQPLEMPWGGYKESGYGKDLSTYAYEDYTQIKHISINNM